ncbi:MAG: DUF1801 domain-containing protein [Bacteroidales bacterium]|nr:DUF1801 domain-containing protein [Bacteroidales bacterium]
MIQSVDTYLSEGCMRCKFGGTPRCKVHNWQEEMNQLRRILLECGLTEEVKWSVPCYTFRKGNVLIMAAFRDYCALSFFKGSLLNDSPGMLTRPTENTRGGRQIRFTELSQILENEDLIKAYIFEAIEIEKQGLKVDHGKLI